MAARALACSILLLGLPLVACKDEAGIEGAPTILQGAYADAMGVEGVIELSGLPSLGARSSLGDAEGIELAGELRIAGRPSIRLTGVYDSEAGGIWFASDDASYQFFGTVVEGRATGVGHVPIGQATFALVLGRSSPAAISHL